NVSNRQAEALENFTMRQKVEEHFTDENLKHLLMADAPHWGSSPERTSYLFDAMLRLSYFLGNYYPRGSSQKFADDLGRVIEWNGGRVLKCAGVEKIQLEGGKLKGVRIATQSKREPEYFEFEAPIIVSNADALHTYRDLLGAEVCGSGIIQH